MPNQYSPAIGIEALRRRGWTRDAIYALLGEPDLNWTIPRWKRSRVVAAETAPGWAERVSEFPECKQGSEPTIDLAEFGGITYRQLDYWTRVGYLKPSRPARGPGSRRAYPDTEKRVAILMGRLVAAGLTVEVAHRVARLDGTCELAPGIRITMGGAA